MGEPRVVVEGGVPEGAASFLASPKCCPHSLLSRPSLHASGTSWSGNQDLSPRIPEPRTVTGTARVLVDRGRTERRVGALTSPQAEERAEEQLDLSRKKSLVTGGSGASKG